MSNVISERGRKRIFEGELLPVLARDGTANHYRVMGRHYEDAGAVETRGGAVLKDAQSYPDRRGVYRAQVFLEGARKGRRQSFFPLAWSREDVEQAIEQAWATKTPRQWGEPGNFYEGRWRGVKIVLEVGADGLVLDAIPIKSPTNPTKKMEWAIANGFLKKTPRNTCAVCGRVKAKRRVCPDGHDVDQRWGIGKRVMNAVLRLVRGGSR
jgi:hypothetical protein